MTRTHADTPLSESDLQRIDEGQSPEGPTFGAFRRDYRAEIEGVRAQFTEEQWSEAARSSGKIDAGLAESVKLALWHVMPGDWSLADLVRCIYQRK